MVSLFSVTHVERSSADTTGMNSWASPLSWTGRKAFVCRGTGQRGQGVCWKGCHPPGPGLQDLGGRPWDRALQELYRGCVSSVEENGWKVVSMVSTSRLTAAYNQVMGISILVISLLLLLFYLFFRYFLGCDRFAPLHSVVEGMREMEEGNLTVHVEPAGQSGSGP